MPFILKETPNKKTIFTRMCITEAILELLKTTPYDRLKVSHIVKKAGIARMTFYKYYHTPYDALTDYINIIVSEYLSSYGPEHVKSTYIKYEHILYSLHFFDQYADYFLTLAEHGLHGIMLEGVNAFMAKKIQTDQPLSVYQIYAYAGGLLNTFLIWEQNGKKESAEEIAQFLYHLYQS